MKIPPVRAGPDTPNVETRGSLSCLNKEIIQRIPSRYLDELLELGRMQKNLFDKGRTPKDKDYL
ncbi:hypothetical protein NXZ37_27315, partial [Escherichia coli]|nr:hypothetical protein [Escherichia coli]